MLKTRQGTILIIVSGISVLLLGMSVAFLARTGSDAEENRMVVREAQARIMLVAACSYVQECSRLGWDDPATPQHEEAYGWIDVRDGDVGPKVEDWSQPGQPKSSVFLSTALVEDSGNTGVADRPAWPAIGGVALCPMYVVCDAAAAIGARIHRSL
jgi:hypothetical protein